MAINFEGAEFVGTFGEITGYKSGLALSEGRLRDFFTEGGYERFWPDDPDTWLRMDPARLEEIFAFILYKLGVGPSRQIVSPLAFVFHQVKDDPAKLALMTQLGPRFTTFLRDAVDAVKEGRVEKIDPGPFLETATQDFGPAGLEVALMITEATFAHQLQSPWSSLRRVEWHDLRQLDELFESEKLGGPHGDYFDERFANFIAANFEQIDKINWRQFEGLAAEFFKREGFAVELGPGRNDDGVDVRLRPAHAADGTPAVILVQCKRQKAKVDKLVVKALWADMQAEAAEGGVIVTTSSFARGATATRSARGYNILEADRKNVRQFVDALKTPGSGVFLGE
jgi:restriction system protein